MGIELPSIDGRRSGVPAVAVPEPFLPQSANEADDAARNRTNTNEAAAKSLAATAFTIR